MRGRGEREKKAEKLENFYSNSELSQLGFRKIGHNIFISKKYSIYSPETISIGDNVRIDDFVILIDCIELENYIHIGAFSFLCSGEKILVNQKG